MSRPAPRRAPWVIAAACVALLAVGCAKGLQGPGLPTGALDHAIGDVVGDPATCVLIAEKSTGKVVYRYGETFNCVRGAPACDRPGYLTATQALTLAGAPGGRAASCASTSDGSRSVGWAEGQVASAHRDLVYSAIMEGQTALPGHEIAARLDSAFHKAGI